MEQHSKAQSEAYHTSDKSSLAYISVRDAWPKIVTATIDDVHRTVISSSLETTVSEGKSIIAGLATLKYELQHDRRLTPLPEAGQADIEGYNKELEGSVLVKWFNAPWLFAECYLYRRIHTFFSLSSHWTTYDVFGRQKLSQLRYARPAVLEIAARYKTLLASGSGSGNVKNEQDEAAESTSFAAMCLLYLEACASDYTLPTKATIYSPQDVQHPPTFDTTKTELLVNDIPSVYKTLKASQLSGKLDRSVSIVPSAAGLPLLANLLFASYLLTTNLATQIILHPKRFPSGVAEATPADIASLLSLLANPQAFFSASSSSSSSSSAGQEEEGSALANDTEDPLNKSPPLTTSESDNLAFIFQHLSALYANGKIVIRSHPFFTSPFIYSHLPQRAPDLFADLQDAELVCFEGGGLQYRKLTGDAKWSSGTTFGQGIEGFARGGSGAGVRVLATRRWSSADGDGEVDVVGLDGDEEAAEKLKKGNGKWGVVQFYDGKI